MRISHLRLALLLLLAVVAGAAGAVAADHWRVSAPADRGMHAFVHTQLSLDDDQSVRLAELEQSLALRRRALDQGLLAANAELANSMQQEHAYGPRVAAAVEVVHSRMGELQKLTIEHLFAMRALLTPAQQSRFDAQVVRSLTTDAS